jgi:SOS-response transcriptional repressor LexA
MESRQIRYLNARLLILRECGGELIRFAERLNKSQPQTSAFAGENPTKGIGPKISRQIDDAFSRNRGWLDLPHYTEWREAGLWKADVVQLEKGVREPRVQYLTRTSNTHQVAIRHIPVISWSAASQLCEGKEALQMEDIEEWLFIAASKAGTRSYALRVKGDAMINPHPGPSYPQGTLIAVDVDRRLDVGSRVIVKRRGEEPTFKVYTEDGGQRLLKPLNPRYAIETMGEDHHICGVVIGHWFDD